MAYNRDEPSFNRDENSQHSSSPLPMPSRGSGPLGNVRKIMGMMPKVTIFGQKYFKVTFHQYTQCPNLKLQFLNLKKW